MSFRSTLLLLLMVLSTMTVQAQRVNDSITVALLTCSPGDQVYELYGHTALRITDHTLGTDAVFNYGVFDFNQPNFILRFTLGKTDYMVQPLPYRIFEVEYIERGSSIVSQRLNLTTEEANELYNNLIQNIRPENCTYRYNFLTCNCTTRVRDAIENAIHGTVQYKEQEKKTYRESLHEFTAESPWAQLGNDLLLGAKTDTLLTDHTEQFLPEYLEKYFADAVIYDSISSARPLVVGGTEVLLEAREVPHPKGFPMSPLVCSLIFVAVMLLIAGLEYWSRHQFWLFDMLLMPGVGIAGLLLTFMFFFSEHPTMNSNWQIWVFNPIPLFCMPWVLRCAFRHELCLYHYFNAGLLILFLVAMPWIPQHFSVITLPVTIGLLTRPVSYIYNFNRLKTKKTTQKSQRKK